MWSSKRATFVKTELKIVLQSKVFLGLRVVEIFGRINIWEDKGKRSGHNKSDMKEGEMCFNIAGSFRSGVEILFIYPYHQIH